MIQQPNGLGQNQQYAGGAQTDVRMGVSKGNKSKHEDAILHAIRNKNKQISDPQMFIAQQFVLTALIQSVQSYHKPNNCAICEEPNISTNLSIAECNHRNLFCKSCLQHYAIYYIQQSSRVYCPFGGCNYQIDPKGDFFKCLPVQVQNKCRRNYQFYSIKSDRQLKMCPREGCSGEIQLHKNETISRCILCSFEICSNCFLQVHGGDCDQFQSQFFYKTLLYQKCPRCQLINDYQQTLTNRLVCSCDYAFCYVCGSDWAPDHQRDHGEEGAVAGFKNEDVVGERKEKQCGEKVCFVITILPRILLAIVIFSLLIALFGLVLAVTILASLGMAGGKNRHYQARRSQNKAMNSCVSGLCACYFQLFSKVVKTFLTC